MVNIAAGQALPDLLFLPDEDSLVFDVVGQLPKQLLMVLFGNANGVKRVCSTAKTFLVGNLRKSLVHHIVNVKLKRCGGEQVGVSVLNDSGGKGPGCLEFSAIEKLEEPESVFILLVGGFVKKPGYLDITVIFCPPGEEVIPGAGLCLG